MVRFMLGAALGGATAYYYRREIGTYLTRRSPLVRERLADGLRDLEKAATEALVSVRTGVSTRLQNAERWLRVAGQGAGNGGQTATPDAR